MKMYDVLFRFGKGFYAYKRAVIMAESKEQATFIFAETFGFSITALTGEFFRCKEVENGVVICW